jgi:hypothetical protein
MKDKAYRATPVGGEVGRFLRSLRWHDASRAFAGRGKGLDERLPLPNAR